MKLINFRADLAKLLEKRVALEVQAAELEKEIEHLKKVIAGLSVLAGQPENPNDLSALGFTDAIRAILRTSIKAMSPTEIRDALSRKGYDLKPYSNPLASIHTILKRLAESGNVSLGARGVETVYRWRRVRLRRSRRVANIASVDTVIGAIAPPRTGSSLLGDVLRGIEPKKDK